MAFTHRASNKAYASIFETPTLLNLVLNKSGEGNHIHIISSYPLHFIKTNTYIYLHKYPNVCTQSPLKVEDKVYIGVPMGYGTIASNGAAHGFKIPKPKH